MKEGIMHSRPETHYFWIYFVGFNAPFILIPSCKSLFNRGLGQTWLTIYATDLVYQALGESQKLAERKKVRKHL
jgi:hypothetical protein